MHTLENVFPFLLSCPGRLRAQHGSLHMAFLPGIYYFCPQAKDRVWGLPLLDLDRLCQPARPAQGWRWSPAAILEGLRMATPCTGHLTAILSAWPTPPLERESKIFLFLLGYLNHEVILLKYFSSLLSIPSSVFTWPFRSLRFSSIHAQP